MKNTVKVGIYLRLVVAACLLAVLLIVAGDISLYLDRGGPVVKAMEYSTWTKINTSGAGNRARVQGYGENTFADQRSQSCGTDLSTSIIEARCGYPGGAYDWNLTTTQLKFDLTTLPAGEVVGVRFTGIVGNDIDTGHWGAAHYYSLYKYVGDFGLCGWDAFYADHDDNPERLTGVVSSADYTTSSNITFTVPASKWSYVTSSSYLSVTFASEYQALNWSPGSAITGANTALLMNNIQIEVDYIPAANPYDTTYDTNAAVDTSILGTEVAENITWGSTRAVFADQELWLQVNGDSGANITVQLVDADDNVLTTVTDSIRVDDNYDFVIDNLDADFDGFVRVRELNFNLMSEWGYVSPVPDSSQKTNRTYAGITIEPQYDVDFSGYVVQRGDIMVVHWKTSIDGSTANLSDYNLEVWSRGVAGTQVYNATFAQIAEDYLKGTETNQQANIHWRYMLFTTEYTAGQSSYNGLVQTLALPFEAGNKGFIQTIVTDNESAEYAECLSAYWYLTNAANGLEVVTNYSVYEAEQDIEIKVNVGKECNVEKDLASVKIELYDDSNTQVVSAQYFTVAEGENLLYVPGVVGGGGEYFARVYFYASDQTYQYITDIEFSIGASAVESDSDGPAGWIEGFLDRFGLDNEGGHWLIMLVLAVILGFAFRRTPEVATGIIFLIFIGGLIFGWINPWFIILLCIGGGLSIYGFIRKRRRMGV